MKLKHKPKWVVFDVGAVLLDWHHSMIEVGKRFGISGSVFHSYLLQYLEDLENGNMETTELWKKLTKKLGSNTIPENLDKLWATSHTPIKESWKLSNDLENAGYKLAILTDNWKGMIKRYGEAFPGFPQIELIVDSSKEGVNKPEEKIYKIVEERTGASGNELFFIDDSKENIEGANKLGWQTYLFETKDDNGKTSCDELRELLL